MAREDFEIVGSKPVGRGAFGTVFAARRISDGAPVALKLVLHSGEWGAERIEAERKGAILQQRFAQVHGMVPELYDFGQDGDDFYIAMEFIPGASLEGLLRQGALSPTDAAGHALWLCRFLEKAHEFSPVVEGKPYRIIHTDLKPAHLMISSSGERKVLDFGIAKALEESRELGTDIGRTIAYASPERLVSDQISPHADFWSLGVMLYEMVCGHRPYPHLEGPRFRRDLEHAITSNAPRAPFPESCPQGLRAIINKLLALQVEHRYPTAEAIKADLEAFLRRDAPAALSIYDTPATVPVQRSTGTSPATTPRPRVTNTAPRIAPASPDTTPHPAVATATAPRVAQAFRPAPAGSDVAQAFRPASAASDLTPPTDLVPPLAPAPQVKGGSALRRLGVMLTMFLAVSVLATECVAWMFAERFRDSIERIDERNVVERKQAYASVDEWALLDLGLRLRVHPRLRQALVGIGDRVIEDYRREVPDVGPSEWTQANEALAWALELSRSRRSAAAVRAKQLLTEAHVRRFKALAARRGSNAILLAEAAVAKFREAADADPKSYDPYLGMARIQVYELSRVDEAAASIAEAEKRGYESGRREQALLGDGYLRRATVTSRRAAILTGEQRWRELNNARSDYERCIAFFDPIVAFGNAAENLENCKAQLDRINRRLDEGYES